MDLQKKKRIDASIQENIIFEELQFCSSSCFKSISTLLRLGTGNYSFYYDAIHDFFVMTLPPLANEKLKCF